MGKRNRKHDIVDELYFSHDNHDAYREKIDPEVGLLNSIINDGEDSAREIYGDDRVDRALVKSHLARTYNPNL
jgi:hypothetical protein